MLELEDSTSKNLDMFGTIELTEEFSLLNISSRIAFYLHFF